MTQLFEAGNLGVGKVAKTHFPLFDGVVPYAIKELAANSSLFGTS
jgi:ribosomal protein L27